MKRYFIKLAYNGRNYHGWQSQQNAHSVQDELEKCLSLKLRESIKITGCGRTDTGVHAREYYAHFDSKTHFDEKSKNDFINRLNIFLPSDITVHDLYLVNNEANARFDALSRTYRYYISRKKNPFKNDTSFYVYGNMDVDAMTKAANFLFDYEDFTSFSKLHSQTNNNLCTIMEARWIDSGGMLVFEITANRFLRNMVRAITGTLIEVGQGKLSLEGFKNVIEARNRERAGFSVPA
ncbi:MAG: tRNA pseudouridine(38-40) synthase TruA, partial [Bacteroidales bacterium]|nr:tRNA pseudouridine(38-40) synthase TruA [Bacteroidales bacterium]